MYFLPSLQQNVEKYINIQKSNVHIADIMPKQEEDQIFQFVLTILSVKMKVKFPCKMTLQQAGRTLTPEAHSNEEGRFVFNQEVRLREQSEKMFTQLNICLITEKGARYISGIAKLYHSQILRSEGQRVVITLSKCLDTQSFCEIRVEKVIREGPVRTRTLTIIPQGKQKYTSTRHNEELNQPPIDFKSPKKIQTHQMGFQSKSQSHFPVTGNLRIGGRQNEQRYRDYAGMSGHAPNLRKSNVSPKDRAKAINSKNKYQQLQFNGDFQRQKMLQAQVYKDNYQKLKQKYLKEVQTSKNQLNKRIMLQNNENNYKLEIVKLRLKTQELEKALVDKNVKLKQLALTLSTLQGRESELNMLKEELANKQHAIDIMDDTIITLSKENDELRFTSKQNLYKIQQKIMILQNELEMSETKSLTKQQELQRQIKNLHQILQNKQGQVLRKTDLLEKEKKNVYELQRNLQNKMFQYDSQLQNQRNLCKQKIDQTKLKIQEANQNSLRLNLQKSDLSSQIDKLKGLLLKNQYQFKLYQQQINNLKSQIDELKPIRDKYNEMIKQLRSLSEQKIILQRNHQKIIVSKETTLESLTMQYKKQIQSLKKTIKQLEDKSKSLSTRFIQSDSQLQIAKNGLQKFKRNNENMSKELTELKQKQKQLRKSLKSKDQQLQDTKKELFRFKQKNQSLFENTKSQVSKNRDELSRLKIQIQTQKSKSQQLAETNSEINIQLARMKMTLQYTQEKYEKLLQSSKQRYVEFEQRIKQQQSEIAICFQKLRVQKANQSDLIARLLKCDNQLSISKDKNQKLIKQLRIMEQKNKQYDNALKSKQTELIQSLKRVSDLQLKIETLQQEKRQLKDQLQFNHNQLQKSKKIVEILQKDYQKAKIDIISYCQKLNERQKQLDDKIAEYKREKENYSAAETKYNSLKKEYQKFKDSISQALSASFTQAIQSFSSDKFEAVKTSNINDTATSIYSFRRGIIDLNNDLINAINSAGKQNKTQIQKLNQKNRLLERDIDLLKNEIEKIQQSNRKQVSQKDRQLSQLQQELRFTKTQKGDVQVEKHMAIEQLEEQINQYKAECQSLISAKDQLQFSLGSLRLQIDRLNQDYGKRIYILANQKNELQQKLQYQCHNTQIAQKRVHELEIEIMNVNSVLILEKQQIYKKELRFAQSEQEKQRIIKDLQFVKKQLKESQERYTQLDIQYTTIKQIKEQYQIKLNEEENKLKQVRMFNKNILNQKEQIIKKELQKNLEVTQLQNIIVNLRHSLQSQEQHKSKFKSDLEETTELTKKYINQVKDLQNILHQQKNKYNQVIVKLREKEQILKDIKEENANMKNRMEESLKRGKMTTDELDIQNNRLLKQLQSLKIESHQKICTLQSQISKVNQQLSAYKDEVSQLEQALFVQRENNNSMHESINRLKQQVLEIRNKLEEMEKAYENLAIQNKQKDQNMFEMGGKIYEYQNRMRQMEEERLKEIEELNNNLSLKYDEDYQEIYQKIQFIEKQKKYFEDKYHEKQVQVSKKNQELRHFQIQQLQFKKMYEEKIKKLEEQKLTIFTDKNKEITKALQQNKAQFQSLRSKETQLRKIMHQLQISRNSIQKLQTKQKQIQNEKQTQTKVYQTEIENLRKKELTFKNFKDTVKSNQWSCQREVRKQIQTFIKKWLQGGQKQLRSQTLIGSIKTMQQGLLGAISIMGKDLQ